ncbi:hypothetical protein RMATCC62417_04760 [Rhizopus microsporus]|nr:hypothetical protein RMATCC62417_04760 [Rhizopus microsporus]
MHNDDRSNKRITQIKTSKHNESLSSQTSGTHPADEVMNELLQDDNFPSLLKRALKQVKNKKA